jgi:hypothetical protein
MIEAETLYHRAIEDMARYSDSYVLNHIIAVVAYTFERQPTAVWNDVIVAVTRLREQSARR